MISEKWQYFLKSQGPVSGGVPVSEGVIEKYRGHLSGDLLEYWKEYGWGNYLGGLLKLCDPADFDGLLSLCFGNDPEFFPKQCTIYAFSAFGHLYGWHDVYGTFEIDLISNELIAFEYFDQGRLAAESDIVASLYSLKADMIDLSAEPRGRLYSKAVKALGAPGLDECFGFVPALSMGGAKTVSGLKRLKALEHFSFLAQLEPLRLMDYRNYPPKSVREIG